MKAQPGEAQSSTAVPVRFESFTEDWIKLQAWFRRVAQLPADAESFSARYGRFQDEQGIKAFTKALADVNEVARSLGNPQVLKQEIARSPEVVLGSTPPVMVYAHLVWLASQVEKVASTFERTLGALREIVDPLRGDSQTRAHDLKTALCGERGLVSTAESLQHQIEALNGKVAPFEPRLLRAILTLNETKLINEANQRVGALQHTLGTLQKQAEEAEQKTHSLWPSTREEARQEHQQLMAEVEAVTAKKQQKVLFTGALKSFFTTGNRVVPALQDAEKTLHQINSFFEGAAQRLTRTCAAASDEQLGNYLWISRALDLQEAIKMWKAIQEGARNFVQQALVRLDEPPT